MKSDKRHFHPKPSQNWPFPKNRAKAGSRTRGAIYHWQGVCEEEQSLYLSIRRALNTEKYPLKISDSRLDDGSSSAVNARLLEIAVVYYSGIKPAKLAHFVHLLRGRFPYFATDVSLPFPFAFAIKAKEYAVSARDSVENLEFDDSEQDGGDRNEQ